MDKDNLPEIFSAIKTDNLEVFSSLVEQRRGLLSFSFGRFPLLSLCFLYNSRKIVKAYGTELFKIKNYRFADEELEMYLKFKESAKKCLRLYIGENALVSPLEMLAVLDYREDLEKLYLNSDKNEGTNQNIAKIYSVLHQRKAEISDKRLVIDKRKLSGLRKICVIIAVILSVIMVAFPAAALGTVMDYFGDGTELNPTKISSETQLTAALSEGSDYYVLTSNITLIKIWNIKDFSGSLNGNGHTITVGSYMANGFIGTLTGKISGLRFIFPELTMTITQDKALLITENKGTLLDVDVAVSGEITEASGAVEAPEDSEQGNVYFSCLVLNNSGTISDCDIDADLTMSGDGTGNAYLSGITAKNSGNIINCSTVEGSEFNTSIVDVCGIAVRNEAEGKITGCVNNAVINQTSSNMSWLPNAAGITLENYGVIEQCFNYGAVTTATTVLSNETLGVYAGGIACFNYNEITKCKNDAAISGSSVNFYVYAAGIAAYTFSTETQVAVIDNCCSYGNISVSATENVYLFAGGISAYCGSMIENCYSASTYSSANLSVYLGGIAGIGYYSAAGSANNYYLTQANVGYGFASILFNNILYVGTNDGVTAISTVEELMQQEVYWG